MRVLFSRFFRWQEGPPFAYRTQALLGDDMKNAMKTLLKIVLGSLGVMLAAAAAVAGYLIYPGTPSSASSVIFQGYVPLPSDGMLSVLDYLTVNDDKLFVTSERTGDVYRVHLRKDFLPTVADLTKLAGAPAAHGVVIDPTSHLAFVTRSEANTVDIFDPAKMTVIKRIPVADDPDAIFYDEFDKLMYVASGDSHLATLIDPSTQTTIATIPLGGAPEYAAFDASTGLLYQNLHDTSTVVAVDIAKRAVVQGWPLQGCEAPTGMAIDEIHHRLFIGCNANSVLAVFDLIEHRVVATLPIGKGPDSVAFDPKLHRIYTTGKSGVLAVIQQDEPNKYKVLDTVHLHYGAHTLTFDPATHALYVAYAGLVVNPRVAVFIPRP
jgi:YVTN family beta-propeller protein